MIKLLSNFFEGIKQKIQVTPFNSEKHKKNNYCAKFLLYKKELTLVWVNEIGKNSGQNFEMSFEGQLNFSTMSTDEILGRMADLQMEINKLYLLYQRQQTQNYFSEFSHHAQNTEIPASKSTIPVPEQQIPVTNLLYPELKIPVTNIIIPAVSQLLKVTKEIILGTSQSIPLASLSAVNLLTLEEFHHNYLAEVFISKNDSFFRSSKRNANLEWPVAKVFWWGVDVPPWDILNQALWQGFYRPPDDSNIMNIKSEKMRK